MITRTEVLKAIADIEAAAPNLYPLDNLTVRVPRGALAILLEAAKDAQYRDISMTSMRSESCDSEWALTKSI